MLLPVPMSIASIAASISLAHLAASSWCCHGVTLPVSIKPICLIQAGPTAIGQTIRMFILRSCGLLL